MLKQQHQEKPQSGQAERKPRQDPLDIPEILEMTCHHLDRRSLTMCLRVCREWHQVLHRQVWKVIGMYIGGSNEVGHPIPDGGPSLPLLRRHTNLVRKLLLCLYSEKVEFPGQNPIHFPWLTELMVAATNSMARNSDGFLETNLPPFIMKHRDTLKRLNICVRPSKELTEAVSACLHLESLATLAPDLGRNEALEIWMDWYESQGCRLQHLELSGSRTDPATADVMNQLFSKASMTSLQSLQLKDGYSNQQALLLVLKSPELRQLSWSSDGTSSQLAAAITKAPPGSYLQKLESISIPVQNSLDMVDFKHVMESLPSLTDLAMTGLGMIDGPITLYLTTFCLRKLKINRCPWADSDAVHTILGSMPSLEVLSADFVSDISIEKNPRPWVCKGLRELTILLPLFSGAASQALVMNQLCQLEGLERLSLRHVIMFRGVKGHLQFRLESGLDRLKALTRMRICEAPKGQTWGESEARWALENWKQLREINIEMDDKAAELLSHRQTARKPYVNSLPSYSECRF